MNLFRRTSPNPRGVPDALREILMLVFAMAVFFIAFALAFPTSRG